LSKFDPSVLVSRSFSHRPNEFGYDERQVEESLRHAEALIGTPEHPGLFAVLAEVPLLKKPFALGDCQEPLPEFTEALVFTTARRGIPYADAFLSFWETFRPDITAGELPDIEIVDPSIHKGHSKDYQVTEVTQDQRLKKLASEKPDTTIVYVFDEFVVFGRALKRGRRIVKEAGFSHVSQLPLRDEGDGIYIKGMDLPFDRDGPHNELVPNEDSTAVEELRHDMRLLGKLAAINYLEFLATISSAKR